MTVFVEMLTGAVPGFDEPSMCHSGKPKRTRCYAVSRTPGRDGWTLVRNLVEEQRHRDGWWCPDCTRQLQDMMEERGFEARREVVAVSPPGERQ
jgi:hypothetical protein